MPPKIGARQNASFRAISTAPSFNKTPVGSSTPPVAYCVCQDLSSSVGIVPSVNFNGDPAYVLNQSIQPMCTGDEAGVALGVKSGTVCGEVKPVKGSSTVNAGGKPAVRELDPCTLNGGNCPGIYVTAPAPMCSVSGGEPPPEAKGPDATPETPNESVAAQEGKGFWGKLWEKTKYETGEAWKDKVEAVKGAAKDIANIPSDIGDMLIKSGMLDQAEQMDESAGVLGLFGYADKAEQLQQLAETTRQAASEVDLPKFAMSNPAQSGGATIATVASLLWAGAGLAKSGIKGLSSLAKTEGALARTEGALAKSEAALAKVDAAGVKAEGELAQTTRAAEGPPKPGAPDKAAASGGVRILERQPVQMDPNDVRFSQTSAGGKGRADKLRESMAAKGWDGPPVDAVKTTDGVTTLDNTRVAVARELGMQDIPVNVHLPADALPDQMIGRFGDAKTWGEALAQRTARQVPPLPLTGTSQMPRIPK